MFKVLNILKSFKRLLFVVYQPLSSKLWVGADKDNMYKYLVPVKKTKFAGSIKREYPGEAAIGVVY